MSANELLQLCADVTPVLELAIAPAQDSKLLARLVNQTAQHLIRELRKLELDEALKPEIINRAGMAGDQLRCVAQRSCEIFERLGGFGYKPQEVAA